MRKLLRSFFTLILVLLFSQLKAQITIGTVDPGPYTPGSSIAATFTLGPDCIKIGNVFNLYLIYPNGTEVNIGHYDGFYSTFVNGTIPPETPVETGYKLQIRSTMPALSSASTSVNITAGDAATARVNSTPINSTNPEIFGFCENRTTNNTLNISNESTETGEVTASIKNEITGIAAPDINFNTQFKTFTPGAAHYTMLVKVKMPNGNVATKAYFIINNTTNTSFTTNGAGLVCLPEGTLTYGVVTTTENGIQSNFPGNTYEINWGDGSTNTYTLCDLKNPVVQHKYTTSSCGKNYNNGIQTYYNVFGVNISTLSPFCGQVGKPLSTYAKVITVTENKFDGPVTGCTGTLITFNNTSVPGQNPNANETSCIDDNVTYNWYINGEIAGSNYSKSKLFTPTFNAPGEYEIKLESMSSGECQGAPFIKTICIQDPPVPAFTLSSGLICLSTGKVTANSSSSVLNNICQATPVYTWNVTPSTGVAFNQGNANPEFKFPQIGIYKISLTLRTITSSTAGCEVTSAEQEVIVNGEPEATLSRDNNLCARGEYTFGPIGTVTKTIISGTVKPLADTYTWTITGGAYTFVAPSTANSQYPTINFKDYGIYTVTLIHKNNCGTVEKTQKLTFSPSPTASITANPGIICHDDNINLVGEIKNGLPNTTFQWIGEGTFSSTDNLITTYIPTPNERITGTANIKLLVNTGITGTCSQIEANIAVTILPKNTGTNTVQNICSGSMVNYSPTSSVAESNFTWTAAVTQGNATGFTPIGSGDIKQVLVNTSTTDVAIVTYTIVPKNSNGCEGVPFEFKVTINPKPILTATPAKATICSNQSAAIALASNLDNTKYIWTSVATNDVTNTVTGNTSPTVPAIATAINDILVNNGTEQGSVTYTITPISDTGCPGTPFPVTVYVDPALTVANAGSAESICDLANYTLKGNPAVVGTGTWTLVSDQTGVTIINPHSKNASVSGLVGGEVYTFRWTIAAPGACNPTSSDVIITVNVPTVAGSTASTDPTTVCEAENSGTITLTDIVGTVIRWESLTDGGTTWTSISNTTTTLTYTNVTASTQYRAVVQNGKCESKFSTPTLITVVPATTVAEAGANQFLCNETSVQLHATSTLKAGETGVWSVIPVLPNTDIVDSSNPLTNVKGLAPGQTYTFTWTITGPSPCGPTHDEVVITDYLPLTNTISSTSAEVCYGQIINITGSIPTGGDGTYSYKWEVSTDGTTWNAIPDENAINLSYKLLATSSFRRTVLSSSCILESNVYTIIAQLPIENNIIASDQTICTDIAPAPLTGSTPTGSDGNFNYQWQLSEDNGETWTNIDGAVFQNYSPPILTATTLYKRIVSTITCNGDQKSISDPVTITVKPNAKAEFRFATDKDCMPFVITAQNITAVSYPDRNATYTWYADDVQIGTGITFPGYTISGSNQSVTIKLVVTPSQGCQSDEFTHVFSTNQNVEASYTQSATEGCGPLVVNFVNTSTSLTNATFIWDFGNGTTSSQPMPAAVTFLPEATGKDTTYTVTLTASTPCGNSVITSTVFVKAKPISIFSPSKTEGCSPLKVTFTNTSPGGTNTYYYDFGDGTLLTKTDKADVEHTYIVTATTDFTVKMIAENECGRDESSYILRVSPQNITPELVVNASEKSGCAPLTVNFFNNSVGATSFTYNFGDGSAINTRTAPEQVQHTFTRAGTYTVTMTSFNSCSEIATTETITVLPQPDAAFGADVTLGCPGLPVQFTNTTQDGFSYLWDFGDGTTSNEFEPKHIYTGDQEYYTVTLTATNTLGCNISVSKSQYIHIVQPPVALFNVVPSTLISIPNYTFKFEDESTNSPTIWAWDFGDGTTSALQNPIHTYPDTGSYVVKLKVSNQQGCFTTTFKTVQIVGVPGYLYVPNSFMPGSETIELREFKAKGSGIKTWKMSIFNKWGQILWETTELNEGRPVNGWDGTFKGVPVPQDVYFWKIDVEFVNGSAWKGMTYDSSPPKKTGAIHLIR